MEGASSQEVTHLVTHVCVAISTPVHCSKEQGRAKVLEEDLGQLAQVDEEECLGFM